MTDAKIWPLIIWGVGSWGGGGGKSHSPPTTPEHVRAQDKFSRLRTHF